MSSDKIGASITSVASNISYARMSVKGTLFIGISNEIDLIILIIPACGLYCIGRILPLFR